MQLLPRDVKFYDLFLDQSRIAVEAAESLRDALASGAPALEGAAGGIRALEARSDDVEHEIYKRLHKTFITPIDPEDIHAIASALDEVVDGIEATAYRLSAYCLSGIPEPMSAMSSLLVEGAGALNKAFEALNDHGLDKKEYVSELCIQVNRIESQTEETARKAVTELFARERDPIALMKFKEIYEHFEAVGDRMENVAGILENVVAKNS